jgi:hypothetical protein
VPFRELFQFAPNRFQSGVGTYCALGFTKSCG